MLISIIIVSFEPRDTEDNIPDTFDSSAVAC
jgi:hypothetical protein